MIKIYLDGDSWCVLYGEDLQEGISGWGDTLQEAIAAFDAKWKGKEPTHTQLINSGLCPKCGGELNVHQGEEGTGSWGKCKACEFDPNNSDHFAQVDKMVEPPLKLGEDEYDLIEEVQPEEKVNSVVFCECQVYTMSYKDRDDVKRCFECFRKRSEQEPTVAEKETREKCNCTDGLAIIMYNKINNSYSLPVCERCKKELEKPTGNPFKMGDKIFIYGGDYDGLRYSDGEIGFVKGFSVKKGLIVIGLNGDNYLFHYKQCERINDDN